MMMTFLITSNVKEHFKRDEIHVKGKFYSTKAHHSSSASFNSSACVFPAGCMAMGWLRFERRT
jgi:hypothetical protein